MRLPTFVSAAIALTALATACGARNGLELADTGGTAGAASGGTPAPTSNGAGASSSSSANGGNGASSTGGAGGTDACAGLVVAEPGPVIVGAVNGARDPQLAFYPDAERLLFTFLGPAAGGSIYATDVESSAPWPPAAGAALPLTEAPNGYALASGPFNPVALIGGQTANFAAYQVEPLLLGIHGTKLPGGQPVFMAAIEDRFFFASRTQWPRSESIEPGSFRPDYEPNAAQPSICLGSGVLGAGVPWGVGFIGAFAAPDFGHADCEEGSLPGSSIDLWRYDALPGIGSFMEPTAAGRIVPMSGDALVQLHLAPTSFGAWLVYQYAGLTTEVPPPPMAMRLDGMGEPMDDEVGIALADTGWGGPVAISAIGDTLVAVWADSTQPSAPLLVVRLLHADGSFGPMTSIPTDVLWQTGPVKVATQPGGNRLFVTWEGGLDQSDVALARIDCVAP